MIRKDKICHSRNINVWTFVLPPKNRSNCSSYSKKGHFLHSLESVCWAVWQRTGDVYEPEKEITNFWTRLPQFRRRTIHIAHKQRLRPNIYTFGQNVVVHYSCASDSLEGAGEQLRRSVDEDRAYNPVHFPWRTIKIEAQTNLWHGALAWVAELYALDVQLVPWRWCWWW